MVFCARCKCEEDTIRSLVFFTLAIKKGAEAPLWLSVYICRIYVAAFLLLRATKPMTPSTPAIAIRPHSDSVGIGAILAITN